MQAPVEWNSSTRADDDPAQRAMQFVRLRWRLIAIAAMLGMAAGVATTTALKNRYTATASIEVLPDSSQQFRIEATSPGAAAGIDGAKLDTEIEVLRTNSLALEVVRTLHLESNPDFVKLPPGHTWDLSTPQGRSAVTAAFRDDLVVSRLGHTNIIEIDFTAARPDLASVVTNALITSYIDHSFRDGDSATEKLSGRLETQLSGLKQNLEKSQARLLELERELGVVGPAKDESVDLLNIEQLNRQLIDAQVDRMVKEAHNRAVESASPALLDTYADPMESAGARQSLIQLKNEYNSLVETYGPAYPPVKELSKQVTELQHTIREQEEASKDRAQTDYKAALSSENMLRGELDRQTKDAYGHGQLAIQYELARREYEANRLLNDGLTERLQETEILSGLHSSTVRVVDEADTPLHPSRPRTGLIVGVGFGVGALLGMILALLMEALDTSLKSMSEIEQGLNLPLLAAIPSVPTVDLQPALFRQHATHAGSGKGLMIAEAFRAMRTSILLSNPASPPKVILFTSSFRGEGRTSTACLMSITLALNGAKTLLIDADLRQPKVHDRFKVRQQPGLSNVLSGEVKRQDATIAWEDLPNLHILTAGPVPPLPSELLASMRMQGLIQDLRGDYDFIVLDMPPALSITDAPSISRWMDACILTLRYGEVRWQVAQRCVDQLARSGANMLGIVVNAADRGSPDYSEYFGGKVHERRGERSSR